MITLVQAKQHLRIDHSGEDADITIRLRMAQAIVAAHLNGGSYSADRYLADPAAQALGDLATDVQDAATLLVLGELYANREAAASDPLSPTVRGILATLRRPGYA